jgi:hypothetical protein
MRQAIDDGVTLEIICEGRTHNAEVPDLDEMDQTFADMFSILSMTPTFTLTLNLNPVMCHKYFVKYWQCSANVPVERINLRRLC